MIQFVVLLLDFSCLVGRCGASFFFISTEISISMDWNSLFFLESFPASTLFLIGKGRIPLLFLHEKFQSEK
jgi:hypothetical protein